MSLKCKTCKTVYDKLHKKLDCENRSKPQYVFSLSKVPATKSNYQHPNWDTFYRYFRKHFPKIYEQHKWVKSSGISALEHREQFKVYESEACESEVEEKEEVEWATVDGYSLEGHHVVDICCNYFKTNRRDLDVFIEHDINF